MTSEKQLEANRRNAQKSTGPRTVEGKARSRLNAFKLSMDMSHIIIPLGLASESKEEYQALLASLRRDLRPDGTMQELLVENIAIQQWRLRRVYRAELAGVVEAKIGNDMHRDMMKVALRTDEHDTAIPVWLPTERVANKLMRYQRLLEGSTSRLLAELRHLQSVNTPRDAPVDMPVP